MTPDDVEATEMREPRHPAAEPLDEIERVWLASPIVGDDPLASFLGDVRSTFQVESDVEPSGAMAEFLDAPLVTEKGDRPATVGSNAHGPVPAAVAAAQAAGLPKWRENLSRRKIKVLNGLSAFLAGVTGKVVLGGAVAAASVGGLQASNVVDVPGLPDPKPAVSEQEIDGEEIGEEIGENENDDPVESEGHEGEGPDDNASDTAKAVHEVLQQDFSDQPPCAKGQAVAAAASGKDVADPLPCEHEGDLDEEGELDEQSEGDEEGVEGEGGEPEAEGSHAGDEGDGRPDDAGPPEGVPPADAGSQGNRP